MERKSPTEDEDRAAPDAPGGPVRPEQDEPPDFRVEDRRHWMRAEGLAEAEELPAVEPPRPSVVEEYRARAEAAERKLQEYIEAYKTFRGEQEQVRERLARDVQRRVDLGFASLVSELLEIVDNLDLALAHGSGVAQAQPLVQGVQLARERFLAALERSGIERVVPDGAAFDPAQAEAVRVDPVDRPERDGIVTETLRPGYRLGETLVRPARVAVGRHVPPAAD